MANTLNPAARLFKILETARTVPRNGTIKYNWSQTLNIPEDDTKTMFLCLAELHRLVTQVTNTIRSIDGINHSLFLKPFPNIMRVIQHTNLHQNWKDVGSFLDDETMARLEHCVDLLRGSCEEPIPAEELESILVSIEDLRKEIHESNLSSDLKDLLRDKLSALEQAIYSYPITGARSIKRAVEQTVGSVVLQRSDYEIIETEGGEQETINRFFTLMQQVNTVADVALKIKKLASPLITLMLGDGNNSDLPQ